MKRQSKIYLATYIIVLILTSITTNVGGSLWPFYLFICVCALLIMLVEDRLKIRIWGFLLVNFAVILIIMDGYKALDRNNWRWKAEMNRIKFEMTSELEKQKSITNNQANHLQLEK